MRVRRLANRHNFVVALIKCGPDQIIHAGIDDRKFPTLGLLDVKDAREKNARVANEKTSRFDNNAHAEIAQRWQRGGCVLRDGQRLAGFFGFFCHHSSPPLARDDS